MSAPLIVLAQGYGTYSSGGSAAAGLIGGLFGLAFGIFFVVTMWRIFTKAAEPGWAAIIPFYNTYVLLRITGKPGWWLIFFFVPIVNLIFAIIVYVELPQRFGKGAGFAIGLVFLPFIFFPILAFGSAQYQAPQAA